MATLEFLPWCQIKEPLEIGGIALVPHERGMAMDGLEAQAAKDVERIFSSYRGLDGKPVARLTLVRHSGKSLLADQDEEAIDATRDLVEIASFAALPPPGPLGDGPPRLGARIADAGVD